MFLASFGSNTHSRPSFFEMVAQQEMMPRLQPALKHILLVIAQRHPEVERILSWSDEIFYAGLLWLESHFLRHYDSSFAENFYGLKRIRAALVPPPAVARKANTYVESVIQSFASDATRLRPRDRLSALCLLVVVPYGKLKLDALHRKLSTSANSRAPAAATPTTFFGMLKQLLKRVFLAVYPTASAIYEGLFFLYQALYLYDYTRYFSPFLHLQGQEIVRLALEEMVEQDQDTQYRRALAMAQLAGGGPLGLARRILQHMIHFVLDYAKFILPLSIFLFNFFHWWYAENRLPSQNLPLPPAPEPAKRAEGALEIPEDLNLCAVCRRVRTNPAVLTTSGFVFCYPCATQQVKDNNRCPVTHLPTSLEQIRKIYEAR